MNIKVIAALLAASLSMQMAFAETITEENAAELIKVENVALPIESARLGKKYSAYKVIMTSDYPGALNVQSGTVTNGVAGQLAYQSAKASAGFNWFWLFFPYIGIIIAPITTAVSHNKNKKAESESIQYPGQVPLADSLQKGETLEFKTLVPLGQKPAIRVVLRDKMNNLTFAKSAQ